MLSCPGGPAAHARAPTHFERVLKLQRQHVILQGHQVQRKLPTPHIPRHALQAGAGRQGRVQAAGRGQGGRRAEQLGRGLHQAQPFERPPFPMPCGLRTMAWRAHQSSSGGAPRASTARDQSTAAAPRAARAPPARPTRTSSSSTRSQAGVRRGTNTTNRSGWGGRAPPLLLAAWLALTLQGETEALFKRSLAHSTLPRGEQARGGPPTQALTQ